MAISFRHSAGFGKLIEHYIVGLMLKQGLDVYLPLVDDDAIDAVIKRLDGNFAEVQIKARSKGVNFGDAALFAALRHETVLGTGSSFTRNAWTKFGSCLPESLYRCPIRTRTARTRA